jgi:hypothetical protein
MEKIESAKERLQLIESFTQDEESPRTLSAKKSDADTQISSTEKKVLYAVSRKSTVEGESAEAVSISKAQLINKINFINFQDRTLLLNFKHRKYQTPLTLLAAPQPCLDDDLDCSWVEPDRILNELPFYKFENLLIPDGQNLIRAEPELIRMDADIIRFRLPENGYEVSSRTMRRHRCENINAQLIQNSSLFSGTLIDFNACTLRIELTVEPPRTFDWINPESPVNLLLSDASGTHYAGECKIIRQSTYQNTGTYILRPLRFEIQRFKHKEFRSQRYKITPSPNARFRHPFTKQFFDLKVIDLSGSGFSVEEDVHTAVLLPGMILPQLELNFANSFQFQCKAQVVYRKVIEADHHAKKIKCGLALLDMDIHDHVKLVGLLHQAKDEKSYICNNVNLDELWDFFFDTGFIYPNKYAFIQKNKEKIKKTYERLYSNNPHIARHFIYQDKGRILGHMAMIRFYENTWMIHHHAARKSTGNKAGLIVLDQIGRMINDSGRIYSLHMDYFIAYYRSENKFPRRIFGGAAKNINDPKKCSVDAFAYYHHRHKTNGQPSALPSDWELVPTQPEDLAELEKFYEHVAGGLMLGALDLTADKFSHDHLSALYHQAGLKRERHFYSLKKNGRLTAIVGVVLSDAGLNLSDLTNCLKVFVVDPHSLTADIFRAMLSALMKKIEQSEIAVLLYPVEYAEDQAITYEKQYNLWVCRLQSSDEYFRYLNRLLRFI